jgi:hypothetical protein
MLALSEKQRRRSGRLSLSFHPLGKRQQTGVALTRTDQ